MNRQDLAEREIENLDKLATAFMHSVEKEFSHIQKKEVTLFLTVNDRYKLLTLRIWMQKYQVSLRYILKTLVPFWRQFLGKRIKTRVKTNRLGVNVRTLTGMKSQEILERSLAEDFPLDARELLYKNVERDRILRIGLRRLNKLEEDKLSPDSSSKTLTDFDSPDRFTQYYIRQTTKTQKQIHRIERDMRKKPYRGNPFV